MIIDSESTLIICSGPERWCQVIDVVLFPEVISVVDRMIGVDLAVHWLMKELLVCVGGPIVEVELSSVVFACSN